MIAIKRSEIINQIKSTRIYDLAIIGGGIHGAVIARLASEYGLQSVLLEKNDYASATSSRSSKMAHGGLRYLELFDFEQVLEGVKAREKLYSDYPGQVVPHPFYIPVYKNDYFFRFKLGLGLFIYDLFNSNKVRRHHWLSAEQVVKEVPELKSHDLMGCFCYYDGLMCDYRLVIDNISLARENSDCLNYANVTSLRAKENSVEVGYQDLLSNQSYEIKAKTVVNVTGNEVDFFGVNKNFTLKFSRGSHLLFNCPWNKPALFLPLPGKARYYFVWPHFGGTLVGTTEREINHLEDNPVPSSDEVVEILERLRKDLPDSNLNEKTLYHSFAGIRSLPVKHETRKNSAQISRKHQWVSNDRVFSLFGGKYTTSEWTAKEGLRLVVKKLGQYDRQHFLNLSQKSPKGGESLSIRNIHAHTPRQDFNLPLEANFLSEPNMAKIATGDVFLGEIYNAFECEQAVTLDDFLFRRTGLGYLPNCDEIVAKLKPYLSKYIEVG